MQHSIQESYYLRLPSGPPTQADIWDGLPAWADVDETCTGLLVTPRCDFAHDKTPVINYLPIISLKDYVLRFGGFSLIEQEISRTRNNLRNAARSLGILEHVNLEIPPTTVLDLIDQGLIDLSEKNANQRTKYLSEFRTYSQRLALMEQVLENRLLTERDISDFTSKRELEQMMRNLVRNVLNDTFFLPPCSAILESPCVVLLRHVYTCRIEVFAKGLNSSTALRINRRPERMIRLKSPYIEALVSRLAALFTRVGLRDLPSDTVDSFARWE
jgi:hypothetical protein